MSVNSPTELNFGPREGYSKMSDMQRNYFKNISEPENHVANHQVPLFMILRRLIKFYFIKILEKLIRLVGLSVVNSNQNPI